MPKERPIIMQGWSVRATLAGIKTKTRRLIKPQPRDSTHHTDYDEETGEYMFMWGGYDPVFNGFVDGWDRRKCRQGVAGDQLWVKETHYYDGNAQAAMEDAMDGDLGDGVYYHATEDAPEIFPKWRSSIFMHRWASRIDLLINNVRVERIQDISEEDARAEGVDPGCGNCGELALPNGCGCSSPSPDARDAFAWLWHSIHAKPKPAISFGKITHYNSFPWDGVREIREYRGKPWHIYPNPWVWIIDYEVIE